ncbi:MULTISPECIES: hypothetical protein [Pseudomonas]|uniref:hypothetical protein n=1 Tax=Pseudomonas TaxID=286 RepID=UPI001F1F7C52|nr:hypothetical protein [Pseudomonas sputi]
MSKREVSEQDASAVSSTGSFVGKHANFCATVLAWQINVKRVVCTGVTRLEDRTIIGEVADVAVIVP